MRLRFFWIVIAAIVLLLLITMLFLGFNKPKTSNTIKTNKTIVMADYANADATVSYTVDGITNGNEQHRAIKITVTKKSRMLEIKEGYQGANLQSNSFTNNQDAFKAFLASIQNTGYLIESNAKTKKGTIINTNIQGQCPLGQKYLFNTYGISGATSFLWTSSCLVAPGTFGGNLKSTQKLFQLQIPNYDTLVKGINLNK